MTWGTGLDCDHDEYQGFLSSLEDRLVSGSFEIQLYDVCAHQQLEDDGSCDYWSNSQKHHGAERASEEGPVAAEEVYGCWGQPE